MCRPRALGFPELLGPACRERDLAFALILSRVVHPASKLASGRYLADTTLGQDLSVPAEDADALYGALDWLGARQDQIEKSLARRHLAPGGLVLFDLTSPYLTGTHCPLAARGYSRDGRRGTLQITYGLMTTALGLPVAVEVFPGNFSDPRAFSAHLSTVKERFGLQEVAKHFARAIDEGHFTYARKEEQIRAEAALDGIYVIRTNVPEEQLSAAQVVSAYKRRSRVEDAFRSLKSVDLQIRPIHHRLEGRVGGHAFLCLLAEYLVFPRRAAWAPLTSACEEKTNPAPMRWRRRRGERQRKRRPTHKRPQKVRSATASRRSLPILPPLPAAPSASRPREGSPSTGSPSPRPYSGGPLSFWVPPSRCASGSQKPPVYPANFSLQTGGIGVGGRG